MPGPEGPWGDALVAAVEQGGVPEAVIDDKVRRVLRLAARTGALDGIVAHEPAPLPNDVHDRVRDLAVRGSVLLRNDGLLPLHPESLRTVALIGPNAIRFAAQGGGSAHVNPEHVVTPLDGLRRALGDDVEIIVRPGVFPHATLPPLDGDRAVDPVDGRPGVRLEYRGGDGMVLSEEHKSPATWWFPIVLGDGVEELALRARLKLDDAGIHRLSVRGTGRFTLDVPGQEPQTHEELQEGDDIAALLLNPPSHTFTFRAAAGSTEVCIRVRPQRNLPYPVTLLGLGYEPPRASDDEELDAAVAAAVAADAVVVLVGSDAETESENADRTTLTLRGRQDELVERVCAANPRTAVVVNAGSPFVLPWAERPAAVLWSWFPGQEGGDAIADILTGTEPGGRLPTTIPAAEADAPILSTRPDHGVLTYSEGGLIGYRAYEATGTTALFPFGHGLSYTTWEYENLAVTGDTTRGLTVEVTVRNSGERRGRDIVQAYLEPSDGDEPLRLVGYAPVAAEPGETKTATVIVPPRVLAVWAEEAGWAPRSGPHQLRVGRSATDHRLTTELLLRPS
jgi:beta-glucosidase